MFLKILGRTMVMFILFFRENGIRCRSKSCPSIASGCGLFRSKTNTSREICGSMSQKLSKRMTSHMRHNTRNSYDHLLIHVLLLLFTKLKSTCFCLFTFSWKRGRDKVSESEPRERLRSQPRCVKNIKKPKLIAEFP